MPNKRRRVASSPVIEPNAAGIDIGATQVFVAVPADRDAEPVRCFETFTAELEKLAAWLLECGIQTVAMESTGVYWIPLFQILEKH
jgi:transposase